MSSFVHLTLLVIALGTSCLSETNLIKKSESKSFLGNFGYQLEQRLSHLETQIRKLTEKLEQQNRFSYLENGLSELKQMLENQNSKLHMVAHDGWIVIQHRFDGSVNFYRGWYEYRNGFGSLDGEYWMGLEKIYKLTSTKNYELKIELKDFNGVTKVARYGQFAIGGESEGYMLKTLGTYSGTAGDSLLNQKGKWFSTYDRDRDNYGGGNCAAIDQGAWWYGHCAESNLNGLHKNLLHDTTMFWYDFKDGYHGLRSSKMMIREV